jgi:hypothetical protein
MNDLDYKNADVNVVKKSYPFLMIFFYVVYSYRCYSFKNRKPRSPLFEARDSNVSTFILSIYLFIFL